MSNLNPTVLIVDLRNVSAEAEAWVFGDNYGKYCKVQKYLGKPLKGEDPFSYHPYRHSLYELHFYEETDALAFKLKFLEFVCG